jgi:hypothetical protein
MPVSIHKRFRKSQVRLNRLFALAMDFGRSKHHPYATTIRTSKASHIGVSTNAILEWQSWIYAQYLHPFYGKPCLSQQKLIRETFNAVSKGSLILDPKEKVGFSIHIADYYLSKNSKSLSSQSALAILAFLELVLIHKYLGESYASVTISKNPKISGFVQSFLASYPSLSKIIARFGGDLFLEQILTGRLSNETWDKTDQYDLDDELGTLAIEFSEIVQALDEEGDDWVDGDEDEDEGEDEGDDENEDDQEKPDHEDEPEQRENRDRSKEHDDYPIENPDKSDQRHKMPDHIGVPDGKVETQDDREPLPLNPSPQPAKRYSTTDYLGYYDHRKFIRLYAFKIEQEIFLYEVKYHQMVGASDLLLKVFTHELAHFFTHQAQTSRKNHWDWMLDSVKSIVEGMAQFYTFVALKSLKHHPKFRLAFYALCTHAKSNVGRPYRIHEIWLHDFSEDQIIQGFVKYVDSFKANLSRYQKNRYLGAKLHLYEFEAECLNGKRAIQARVGNASWKMIYCPPHQSQKHLLKCAHSDGLSQGASLYEAVRHGHDPHATTSISNAETLSDDSPKSGFWISDTPVTQELWYKVMGYQPSCYVGSNTTKNPVESVLAIEIYHFCNRLSQMEGLQPYYDIKVRSIAVRPDANGYRLPTSVEWTYAAKANCPYQYSGSDRADEVAWFDGNAQRQTYPVKRKKGNLWGIYDMSGNVNEMVTPIFTTHLKSFTRLSNLLNFSFSLYGGSFYSSDPKIFNILDRSHYHHEIWYLQYRFERYVRNNKIRYDLSNLNGVISIFKDDFFEDMRGHMYMRGHMHSIGFRIARNR